MTPELIIELIRTILGTGGLITIFLITEKKTAAQLENISTINQQWQQIVSQKEHDLSLTMEKYEAATRKIEHLYDDNSDIRNKLDSVNTECAVAKILRCDITRCPERIPPFGTVIKTSKESYEHKQNKH